MYGYLYLSTQRVGDSGDLGRLVGCREIGLHFGSLPLISGELAALENNELRTKISNLARRKLAEFTLYQNPVVYGLFLKVCDLFL